MAFSGISNKLDPENKGKKQKIILAGAGLLVLAGAAVSEARAGDSVVFPGAPGRHSKQPLMLIS